MPQQRDSQRIQPIGLKPIDNGWVPLYSAAVDILK